MKKVAIINYNFGRNEPHSELCKMLQKILETEKIESDIVDTLAGDVIRQYDVFIFVTRKLLSEDNWVKGLSPGKMVVVWTLDVYKEDKERSVLILQKGDHAQLRHLIEEIKSELAKEVRL